MTIAKAYEAVHETLQDEILSGRLNPGERLPTEAELSARFGVTRHTVREGMRVLEQTGLVQRGPGRRLHVMLPKYKQLAPRASRALLMQKVSFRELWEISLHLEVCAVELLAHHLNDSLLADLEENIARMETAHARGGSIIDLDIAFHTRIAEGTGNRVLLLAREPVSLLFYPSLAKLFNHPVTRNVSPNRLIAAHRHIVQALRTPDFDQARLWMKRHMVDFRRGYDVAGLALDAPVDSPMLLARPPSTEDI